VQTHLVYVFAKLDIASRAQLAAQVTRHRLQQPPRHRSHRLRTALCPVSFRAGRICPALSSPPQQTAEKQRFTAQPGPVRRRRDPPDGGCLMLPRGGTVKTMSPREGDGRRGRRRLIVTEE